MANFRNRDDGAEMRKTLAQSKSRETARNGKSRKPRGEPTDLNIEVLNDYLYGRQAHLAPGGVLERVQPTDSSHLRRLIDAKWLVPFPGSRGRWVLSPLGRDGLFEWRRGRGLETTPNPTKKGRYGDLSLYELTYRDKFDDAAPVESVRLWAYRKEHAELRFDEDPFSEYFEIVSIRKV